MDIDSAITRHGSHKLKVRVGFAGLGKEILVSEDTDLVLLMPCAFIPMQIKCFEGDTSFLCGFQDVFDRVDERRIRGLRFNSMIVFFKAISFPGLFIISIALAIVKRLPRHQDIVNSQNGLYTRVLQIMQCLYQQSISFFPLFEYTLQSSCPLFDGVLGESLRIDKVSCKRKTFDIST